MVTYEGSYTTLLTTLDKFKIFYDPKHQFLDEMQAKINTLDDQITDTFFKVYDV